MSRTSLLGALAALSLCCALPALASPIVVGAPGEAGTGDCAPFACAGQVSHYQQVYASGLFTGPITITGLEFFNTTFDSGVSSLDTGAVTIDLSTTSAGPGSLSTTFASNIGVDNTQVFNASINQAWAFGDTLTLTFATPFTYNPLNGNLLMDVSLAGAGTQWLYFDERGVSAPYAPFGRVLDFGGSVFGNSSYGLVTGFMTNATSVPEPGSLPMFGVGLGMLAMAGALTRRRFRSAAVGA